MPRYRLRRYKLRRTHPDEYYEQFDPKVRVDRWCRRCQTETKQKHYEVKYHRWVTWQEIIEHAAFTESRVNLDELIPSLRDGPEGVMSCKTICCECGWKNGRTPNKRRLPRSESERRKIKEKRLAKKEQHKANEVMWKKRRERIAADDKSGKFTQLQLAAKYGCSRSAIQKILNKCGLTRKTPGRPPAK